MSSKDSAVVTQINETHITSKTYIFTWVLKNFNFNLPLDCEECITSAPFQTEYGLFEINLYPGGKDSCHDYVSLEIVNKTNISENSRSVLSFLNMDGAVDFYVDSLQLDKAIFTQDKTRQDFYVSDILYKTDSLNDFLMLDKFVKRCNITSDFLLNGHLTIKWKLYFYIGAESFESSPTIQSMQNLAEKRRLAVLDNFEKLLKDSRFSDIKIVVGTQTFSAHKCILAAQSHYFAAMFESNMKEVKEGEVHITDISANIMEEILRFIYTGKISVEQTRMTDLLIVADMYGLDELITICEEEIISNMSLENIENILTVTDRLSNTAKLKHSAIQFLTMNAKKLSGNDSFRKVLDSLSPTFLTEVINIMMLKI